MTNSVDEARAEGRVALTLLAVAGCLLECTWLAYLPLNTQKGQAFVPLVDLWPLAAALALPLDDAWRALLQLTLPALRFVLFLTAFVAARKAPRAAARRLILAFACLQAATLFILPGTLSSDLYLYVVYGRMQLAGLSPYTTTVSASADFLLAWFPPDMRLIDIPLYGPFWMFTCKLLVSLAPGSPVAQILLMRGFLAVCAVGMIFAVDRLLLHGAERDWHVPGLCLVAWNPLVLLELAGEAHNDALMLLLVALALGAAAQGRNRAGIALLAIGVGMKYTLAPVWACMLVYAWPREGWRSAAACMAISAAFLGLGFLPYGTSFLVTVPNIASVTGENYSCSFPIVVLFLIFRAAHVRDSATADTIAWAWRSLCSLALAAGLVGALATPMRTVFDAARRLSTFYAFLYLVVTSYMWPHYMVTPMVLAALNPSAPMLGACVVASGTIPYLNLFAFLGAQSTADVATVLGLVYGIPLGVALVAWTLRYRASR